MSEYISVKNESKRLSLYKNLGAAVEIIEHGQLKMRCNSFRFMNDPRERTAWRFRTHDTSTNEILKRELEFANTIKAKLGLLCFAMDHPEVCVAEEAYPNADYYYGYHRPRMWAQYAENHQGVCLVFNREKLIKCMEKSLEPYGIVYHGGIDYFDGRDLPDYLPGEIDADVTSLLVNHDFNELERLMFQTPERIQIVSS